MCREQAHGELQGQRVTGEERVRMQDALQRLNNLDNASDSSSGSCSDADEPGAGVTGSGPLSKKQRQTMEALAEKLEQVRLPVVSAIVRRQMQTVEVLPEHLEQVWVSVIFDAARSHVRISAAMAESGAPRAPRHL